MGLKKKHNGYILPVIFFIAVASFYGCSSGLKVASDWRDGDIIIDGNDAEWQTGLYYDKESDIVYGVRNDNDYIYILLKTQNRSTQRQILGSGFVVWFDAEGGKNFTFGIHYPLDRQNMQPDISPNAQDGQNHSLFDQSFPELEIIGPKKEDVQRFPILEVPGIHVKIKRSREALVYELQVPLKKTAEHPFAINSILKNRIGIGFEATMVKHKEKTGDANVSGDFSGKEGASMEGGEHRGRGSGRGHRGNASEGNEKPTELDLWLSVQLASLNTAEQK